MTLAKPVCSPSSTGDPALMSCLSSNVGTEVDLRIRELAEAVADTTGYKGTVKWDSSQPDGIPKKQLDFSRLVKLVWRASIPLVEGLEKTMELFRHDFSKHLARL